LLEFRLPSNPLTELEDELLEPKLLLSCCRTLAPWELVDTEASCERPVLIAEVSPAPIAWTIARIKAADSPWLLEDAEAAALVAAVVEEAAFRAVESSESISCWAELKSPLFRSVPS
jgi:hypothetical protein